MLKNIKFEKRQKERISYISLYIFIYKLVENTFIYIQTIENNYVFLKYHFDFEIFLFYII